MNPTKSVSDNRKSPSISTRSPMPTQAQITLSERQQEIIALLAEGKSNKEIADLLKIGYGTVKQHLFVLFRKLGVTNRTKAVITATHLMKERPNHFGTKAKRASRQSKLALVESNSHSWRLVSAIVISAPDANLATPEELSWRNHYLMDLRDALQAYVDALDGQFLILPYGGMLAWFGYPNTHLDDADRAVKLAQFTQYWSDQYALQDSALPLDRRAPHLIGVGVASKPEMSSDRKNELFASDSFRLAAILARNARSLKHPLADSLTKKLAPNSVSWLTVKAKAPELTQVGDVSAIGGRDLPPTDLSFLWGGLPFFQGVVDSVKSGVAQWIAVESWPPINTNSLIDAMGNAAQLNGFQAIQIRTPSFHRRDKLLQSFLAQAEYSLLDSTAHEFDLPASAGEGERLGNLFAQQAMRKPLIIQAYGLKAFEEFKLVLGERGIDRMAARPIIVIAANLSEIHASQTSVRLLGPRPVEMPFSRVYTMQAPVRESLPEGIRVDLQAILDDLSPPSQSIVLFAAKDPSQSIEQAIAALHLPHHQSQGALHELTSIGVIVAKQGGGFEFRDLATAEAIQRLSLPRA
ncbi:MAG: LuxR C-terminal-related transcriptional regulator [Polynucleobacter sp.]|nr:LuxR C-terminal-related transcriptional regulator [Polynucleobacter sp.]